MINIGLESVRGLKSTVARLEEIARSLGIPVSAFGDLKTCDLGQTVELLHLWHAIEDPRTRVRVLSVIRKTVSGCEATAVQTMPEPDPVA